MSSLDGFGARLAELMTNVGQNQHELAAQLGVSQGFVSDLVRGNKKPGAEFLHSLRASYALSVDWLLTGEGTMYGGNPVELELFKLIVAEIALARAAMIDGKPQAQSLVRRLQGEGAGESMLDEAALQELAQYAEPGDESMLAAVLYNSHLWTARPDERVRNALSGALAYFQAKRPLDVLNALRGGAGSNPAAGPSATGRVQLNIGKSVRAAGRDYIEKPKRPRKD